MLFCAFPQAINAMQSFAARGLYPTHTAIPDSGLWGPWFWWGGRDHGIIFLSFSWNPQKPILKFPRMLGGLPSPAPTSCRDRHEAANHVHLSEKVTIHLRLPLFTFHNIRLLITSTNVFITITFEFRWLFKISTFLLSMTFTFTVSGWEPLPARGTFHLQPRCWSWWVAVAL